MREEEGEKWEKKVWRKMIQWKRKILKEKADKGLEISISKVSTQKVNDYGR